MRIHYITPILLSTCFIIVNFFAVFIVKYVMRNNIIDAYTDKTFVKKQIYMFKEELRLNYEVTARPYRIYAVRLR